MQRLEEQKRKRAEILARKEKNRKSMQAGHRTESESANSMAIVIPVSEGREVKPLQQQTQANVRGHAARARGRGGNLPPRGGNRGARGIRGTRRGHAMPQRPPQHTIEPEYQGMEHNQSVPGIQRQNSQSNRQVALPGQAQQVRISTMVNG